MLAHILSFIGLPNNYIYMYIFFLLNQITAGDFYNIFVEPTFVKSLPKDKILDLSKLKAFADDKINVTQKLKFKIGRVENIVGKGENADYQHFLLFL